MPEKTSPLSCQTKTPRPSLNLALLSTLVVHSYDRRWLSGPVQSFIPQGGPSLEQLSRLKARLLGPMEDLLARATRRGRPPRLPEKTDESLLLGELLLLVPPETWRYLPRERRLALVEAQARLKKEHGLTARRFSDLLGIPERTFRSWKAQPPQSPPQPQEKKPSRRATGRFDLEVTLPGIQAVADTSSWELFGVPLKIIAIQDPGERKRRLWQAAKLTRQEDSEIIVQVFTEALGDKPGTQAITDQGTPYMSEATESALETLDLDHAPQKEGTPTEKATQERAFRTVKDALKPLVNLTNRVAKLIPSLRRPRLALSVGRILLSAFLRVYEQAPRQGGHPLEGRTPTELQAISEEQRERARAEGRSKRLLLSNIHQAYNFPGSREAFIRAHRHHALEDIQEAEERLRSRACRCVARACDRYFAGILRNVAEENQARRRQEREDKLLRARDKEKLRKAQEEAERWARLLRDHPEAALEEGLQTVSGQWMADKGVLLLDGIGRGGYRVGQALQSLKDQDPYTVRDRSEAAWKAWAEKNGKEPARVAAVRRAFERKLAQFLLPTPCLSDLVSARIQLSPNKGNRPPPGRPDLRN